MRLFTRGDLDGLACALLLQEVEPIESVELVHPKDVQDGKVSLAESDILANLPHDPRSGMWFDHHASEAGEAAPGGFKGAYAQAPSAARVIWNHYRSPKFERYEDLIGETDRLDSAQLTLDDVLRPQGWILVGYTLDPRTGLGAFRDYFTHLISLSRSKTVEGVLQDPDVRERVQRVRRDDQEFLAMLQLFSQLEANVVVTDLRGQRGLPAGNRFLIYTLYPSANVWVRVADGKAGEFITIQVGHSIFNRTCKTHVGDLMHAYGGGGHRGAGTCQPSVADADRVVGEIVATLTQNG
jgi:nanoRNase/pAp phosphatase (c-di-AMP/oligoRNAs hydrolase)